jgi:hypothetical protein
MLESYRRQKRHSASELNTDELRKLRLVAIKEETAEDQWALKENSTFAFIVNL